MVTSGPAALPNASQPLDALPPQQPVRRRRQIEAREAICSRVPECRWLDEADDLRDQAGFEAKHLQGQCLERCAASPTWPVQAKSRLSVRTRWQQTKRPQHLPLGGQEARDALVAAI